MVAQTLEHLDARWERRSHNHDGPVQAPISSVAGQDRKELAERKPTSIYGTEGAAAVRGAPVVRSPRRCPPMVRPRR